MNYKVTIDNVDSIDEIENRWNKKDYIDLLDLFEFGNPGTEDIKDLKELLFLVISEQDPRESAEVVLRYKLGDRLNDGQYDQLSNDMLKENVAEHYSDISFQSELFDINELLYKAYNGKFPHAKATVITFTAIPQKEVENVMDKALALKILTANIDDHALLKRLFQSQLDGTDDFVDAQHLAWYFKKLGSNQYQLTTSNYWISNSDLIDQEFEVKLEES